MRRTLLAPLLGSEAAALHLGAPFRGAVARATEGAPELRLLPIVKRKSAVKQPLSLRGAKRRGNPHPLYAMCKYTAVKKEKRIPTTSVSTGLGMTVVFYTLPSLFSTGTYYQLEQCAKDSTRPKSPRRGRPPCRPAGITDVPKHYTTLPYFIINHYIILSAKHKPRKNQIRLFLFIFMCYNSLCIGIILYFYERHTQWDFSIRFSAATMTVS